MKKTIIICILLLSTLSNAQNIKKIFKEYKNNKIKEAYEELSKFDIDKHKYSNTELNLFLIAEALIISDERCEEYEPYTELKLFEDNVISDEDLPKVLDFLNKYEFSLNSISKILYNNILSFAKKKNTEFEFKRALDVCINCEYKYELKELLVETAFKESVTNGTSEKLKYFLKEYPNSKYKNEVQILIETNYYNLTKEIGTIDSFKDFIRRYPKSDKKNEIEKLLNSKAFEIAKTDLTIDSMNNYIKSYPKSDMVNQANEIVDSLALSFIKIRNYKNISDYIKSYPNSKYKSELILKLPDYLFDEITENITIEKCNEFINNYKDDKRIYEVKNKLELAYINSLNTSYSETLFNFFKTMFPNSKYITELNAMLLKEKKFNNLNWDWGKSASGTINSGDILSKEGENVITDSKGNVYCLGNTHGKTIIFDNISYNLVPNYEGVPDGKHDNTSCWNTFFVKYDTKGNVIWVKIIKEYDSKKIAIDSKDDIYISCDGHSISKYNSEGEKIWEKSITMTGVNLTVESPNNFYLVGETNSNLNIVKYDSNGNILWSKELQKNDNESDSGFLRAEIKVDNSGYIYIAGMFSYKELKFGSNLLYLKGLKYKNVGMNSTNGFLLKCDDSGELVWSKNLGVSNSYNFTLFNHIAINGDSDVYVSGFSDSNLNVGNSISQNSAFLIKYNKDGDILWSKSIANCGQLNHRISAITVNRFGNIYVAGFSWCESLSFGKFYENAINGNLNFISKYNSNGEEISTKSFKYIPGSKSKVLSECNAITTDNLGNIFVTGWVEGGGLKIGNTILKQQSDRTYFISKMSNTIN